MVSSRVASEGTTSASARRIARLMARVKNLRLSGEWACGCEKNVASCNVMTTGAPGNCGHV